MVTVRLKDLGELDDKPTADDVPKSAGNGHHKSKSTDRAERDIQGSNAGAAQQGQDRDRAGNGGEEPPWLMPHIRVKIIDKMKANGK